MKREYRQQSWDAAVESDLRRLAELAIAEDSGAKADLTSYALVAKDARGKARIVAREAGILAGARGIPIMLELYDPSLVWNAYLEDGAALEKGSCVGELTGPAIAMLGVERLLLNLLGHLSGVASLTRKFVDRVAGTRAHIYDTRKTTLGWRRLEKYAVHCGGGRNHRMALYDHILIKDNHLAFAGANGSDPAWAVRTAREWLRQHTPPGEETPMVEIEVDTLEQMKLVLPENPDIILLDNMGPERLKEAVALRDAGGADTELEASGGVHLDTVAALAASGVERISSGALTHSAKTLDLGLDWE